MTVSPQQLVGPSEAGRRLNLSADRIRQLARAGVLPAVMIQHGQVDSLAFAIEDLDRLAEQRAARRAQ